MDNIVNADFHDAFIFLIPNPTHQYDGIDRGVVVLSELKVFLVASSSVTFVHPQYLAKNARPN